MANRPSHIVREKAEQDKGRLDDLQIEQELAQQRLERSVWGRMLPLLRPVRGRIAAVALLETVLVGFVFLRPWFIRTVIDRGLTRVAGGWTWNPRVVLAMSVGLAVCWVARFALAALVPVPGRHDGAGGAGRSAGPDLPARAGAERPLLRPRQGRSDRGPHGSRRRRAGAAGHPGAARAAVRRCSGALWPACCCSRSRRGCFWRWAPWCRCWCRPSSCSGGSRRRTTARSPSGAAGSPPTWSRASAPCAS